jgi:hypothetical protein
MKPFPLALLIAGALCISGCGVYGDVRVYGAYRAVSPDDLRAVVAAAPKHKDPDRGVYGFRIISKDEVWLYHSPPESMLAGSYYIMKRVRGHWRCDEEFHQWTIVHPI